ncbi:hypothetical protein KKD37_03975 [Patescibacteria group bacterium]|nr:hypothetical protein [Patescibacteria group bacterium]
MKENIRKTNIGNIAKRAAIAVTLGVTMAKFAPDAVEAIINYDTAQKVALCAQIDSYLTTPPESDQTNTRVRSLSNDFGIKMDQTEIWDPIEGRWSATDRQFTYTPVTGNFPFNQVNDRNGKRMFIDFKETFPPSMSNNDDIQRRVNWGDSTYLYCLNKDDNTWQEVSKEDILQRMPFH